MKKKGGKRSPQRRTETEEKKWVSFLGFTLFQAMFTSCDFKSLYCKYLLVQTLFCSSDLSLKENFGIFPKGESVDRACFKVLFSLF